MLHPWVLRPDTAVVKERAQAKSRNKQSWMLGTAMLRAKINSARPEGPKRLSLGLQEKRMPPRRTKDHFHVHQSCRQASTAQGNRGRRHHKETKGTK